MSREQAERLAELMQEGRPTRPEGVLTAALLVDGDLVRLVMHRGALDVSGPVQALESGARGQVINALYLATRKKLRVRIRDQDTVEYAVENAAP